MGTGFTYGYADIAPEIIPTVGRTRGLHTSKVTDVATQAE